VRGGRAAFGRFWKRHSKGQAAPEREDKVFKACQTTVELYRQLRQTGQLPFDYADIQDELRADIDLMESLQREAERLAKQIDALYVVVDPERTLESLRGIGRTIAATIEALVGDINRFTNARHLVSYCGLAPRVKKSGHSDKPMPISKAGHRLLKKYMYLAAEVARQWDPEFAAYYAKRYAQGDAHNRIVIALARKMVTRIYALLRRRARAHEAAAQDKGQLESPVYILRNPEGQEVTKRQARQIIVDNYARAIVAPQRSARDAAKKGKSENAAPGLRSGRQRTPQAE